MSDDVVSDTMLGHPAATTAPAATVYEPEHRFRPSEYTALLIQMLRSDGALVRGVDVLEIGCGSGVVLAALGALGARSLNGVDVERGAISITSTLLQDLGFDAITTLHQGDMWQPVSGQRFGLIVANLPHFPCRSAALPGRLATWSSGGFDGRRILNQFLQGVDHHLAESGRALITHNGFVDIARSRSMLAAFGLKLHIRTTTLLYLPEEKLTQITPSVLDWHTGKTIHRIGNHAFAEMHIAEIHRATGY
jgi:release factor glutamine methyltransferase